MTVWIVSDFSCAAEVSKRKGWKTSGQWWTEVSVIIVQSFAPWVRSEVIFIVPHSQSSDFDQERQVSMFSPCEMPGPMQHIVSF